MLSKGTTLIHTPKGSGRAILANALDGWDQDTPAEVGDEYLLMRDPIDRIKILYQRAVNMRETTLGPKEWLFSFPPLPQYHWCAEPIAVIHIETYREDMATLLQENTKEVLHVEPDVDLCMATRANIRRIYAKDYLLGEYE